MVLHGIAWYCIVLHSIAWYCMVLHGMAWYCMVLHGIAWYGIVLHGIAWYCMILHDIALYCMVLHGIAWFCMVLHVTAWYCMLWNVMQKRVPFLHDIPHFWNIMQWPAVTCNNMQKRETRHLQIFHSQLQKYDFRSDCNCITMLMLHLLLRGGEELKK